MSKFAFKDYRQPSTQLTLRRRMCCELRAMSFEWFRYRFAEDHKTTSSCRMTIVCCLLSVVSQSES